MPRSENATATAPFSARRLAQLGAQAVDAEVARRRQAGEQVTDADIDVIIEEQASRTFDALPPDALEHFVQQGIAELVQEHLDDEVVAGRAELLPNGSYRWAKDTAR